MRRASSLFLTVAIMSLVLVASGCRPKKPATVAAAPEPAPPTVSAPEPAPEPPPPVDPFAGDLDAVNQYIRNNGLLGDVYFDFDRSDLRADAVARLEQNAKFLREQPQFLFTIEGHCDERGTNDYNLALGERRAAAARARLVDLGIDASRVRTVSYGEERPVCTSSDEACWQRNRRAHFVVTGRR